MLNRKGCLTVLFLLAFNLTIGTISVIEIFSWFGIVVPKYICAIIGFFLGEFTIPIALVGWIFRLILGV